MGALARVCATCCAPPYLGRVARWPENADGGASGVGACLQAVAQLLRATLARGGRRGRAGRRDAAGGVPSPDAAAEPTPKTEAEQLRIAVDDARIANAVASTLHRTGAASKDNNLLVVVKRLDGAALCAAAELLVAARARRRAGHGRLRARGRAESVGDGRRLRRGVAAQGRRQRACSWRRSSRGRRRPARATARRAKRL